MTNATVDKKTCEPLYQADSLDYILQNKFGEALKILELSMAEFKQRHNFGRVADCLDTCANLPETSAEKRTALKNGAKTFRDRAFFYPSDIFLETLIRG